MGVLYAVTEKMPNGYTLVEEAEVVGNGKEMEVHFAEGDIRMRAEDSSIAFDFMGAGIIKSILEASNDTVTMFVICSQKLYHALTGQGNDDFRTIK